MADDIDEEIIEPQNHEYQLSKQNFSSLEELSQWEENWQKNNFAHIKLPAAFLTPHTVQTKEGRSIEKAYVSIPKGTKINNVDISGFSCDVFVSDRMKQQMLDGDNVTLSFKGNEPVTIWTGKKDSEQYPYKQFQVKPWDFVKGIKQQLDDYKQAKAKKQSNEHHHPWGLSVVASESRESSDVVNRVRVHGDL
ncbi:hypothetical protein, partial [Streptococcus equi]|uniref:hypothetical protein n=1 Tax=Streptococcus equi TaxID=1336 RepID=UPI001969F499